MVGTVEEKGTRIQEGRLWHAQRKREAQQRRSIDWCWTAARRPTWPHVRTTFTTRSTSISSWPTTRPCQQSKEECRRFTACSTMVSHQYVCIKPWCLRMWWSVYLPFRPWTIRTFPYSFYDQYSSGDLPWGQVSYPRSSKTRHRWFVVYWWPPERTFCPHRHKQENYEGHDGHRAKNAKGLRINKKNKYTSARTNSIQKETGKRTMSYFSTRVSKIARQLK